jgi:phospholipid/cholesterol/gamma-HCH transport system permease protein
MLFTFEKWGNATFGWFAFWGDITRMVVRSFRAALWDRSHSLRSTYYVVAAQTYFTGWQAMPLICMLAFSTGALVIFYTAHPASPLGDGDVGTTLLYLLVGCELGPLITGLVVIARSGSAVATELGNMRANGETEALEVLAIDPLSYIVFPRLVAGVVSVLCLVIYFDLVAFVGAYFATGLIQPVPFTAFCTQLLQHVRAEDLFVIALKSVLMGIVIFSVSSYQGLQVRLSAHEVPQVTTRAVVVNIVAVALINFTLTGIMLWRHFQGGQW